MSLESPVIGYTLGDQAGIGPEIIRKALAQLPAGAEYRLIGAEITATPGKPCEHTARAALEHLELAAEALRTGAIDAVVTAPVCKEGLHAVGFEFPGQTEFFAARLGVGDNFAMCLTGRHLTVALGTIHEALANVPHLLSTAELVRIGRLLADFLQRTGHAAPRIAVAALNPHAGEGGAFGHEEIDTISPAVEELQHALPHCTVCGPCVPDCVYRDAVEGAYDAVLSPYHDQGLIPLKLVDFDNAVNVTLGLPRLRVSPDHGTAFNIAGKGIANPSSTIRAFELARKSVR